MKVPVRRDLAMTGEITLRGRVLPIGGLKEKLLAAHRGGITTVILPKENRKDLRDVPRRVLKALRLVLVDHVDDVLREALVIPDPVAVFGAPANVLEYRDGELWTPERAGKTMPAPVGEPTPAAPAAPPGS
jgi:ATP-dependent Lon protease